MTENDRAKEVRKALGLTLDKFGERIGIKKSALSAIENGRNSLTEQNIKSICREFNVDYMWLTTGEGEMFFQSDDMIIAKVDEIMAGCDETHKNLIKLCATKLDRQDIEAIERIMQKFADLQDR